MKFRVKAVDASGAERTATISATGEEAAVALAKAKGLFVTKIVRIADEPENDAPLVEPEDSLPSPRVYEYKMVQIPPNIVVERKRSESSAAALYLEKIVNEYAAQGWEFHRIDSIGVELNAGCLTFFSREQISHYYVITFRRRAIAFAE